MWEERHLANGRLVGEQHHETIHADAKTTGRRQTVFEGQDVFLVDRVRLVVTLRPGGRLLLEPTPLIERIIELGERIAESAPANSSYRSVRFGSRRCSRASGEVSLGWSST